MLKDKDERTIVVMFMPQFFASSICFLLTFASFALIVYGAFPLFKLKSFMLFVAGIAAVYIVAEKLSYKILNDKI